MPREPKKVRGVFQRENSNKWSIRFTDQYGTRRQEVASYSHSSVVQQLHKRQDEVLKGKFDPENIKGKHTNVLFRQLIEDRLEMAGNLRSFKDEKLRLNQWNQRLGDKPAKAITRQDILEIRLDLLKSMKPSTANRYLSVLRTCFNLAVVNQKIEKSPLVGIRMSKENNKRVRWLKIDEEERLFSVVPKEFHPAITFAIHTGLRMSEQTALQWDDIDFTTKTIYIRNSKSGESGTVPMNETVTSLLRILPRKIGNPLVFYFFPKARWMQTCWKKWTAEVGVDDFRWHDLRYSITSRLVMQGVDLYTVSKLMRHGSIVMTERYAHLAPDYLQKGIDMLDNWGQRVTRTATQQN